MKATSVKATIALLAVVYAEIFQGDHEVIMLVALRKFSKTHKKFRFLTTLRGPMREVQWPPSVC